MVGKRSFHFGGKGLFSGAFGVSFREGTSKKYKNCTRDQWINTPNSGNSLLKNFAQQRKRAHIEPSTTCCFLISKFTYAMHLKQLLPQRPSRLWVAPSHTTAIHPQGCKGTIGCLVATWCWRAPCCIPRIVESKSTDISVWWKGKHTHPTTQMKNPLKGSHPISIEWYMFVHLFSQKKSFPLPFKTNSLPLKIGVLPQKEMNHLPNHWFSGANLLLVSGKPTLHDPFPEKVQELRRKIWPGKKNMGNYVKNPPWVGWFLVFFGLAKRKKHQPTMDLFLLGIKIFQENSPSLNTFLPRNWGDLRGPNLGLWDVYFVVSCGGYRGDMLFGTTLVIDVFKNKPIKMLPALVHHLILFKFVDFILIGWKDFCKTIVLMSHAE